MLYHGTSQTAPDLIYGGREGFDMNFSPGGMWGIGNYFAVNASYSDNYSHTTADKTKQMFLARVLVGNTIKCQPDSKLRMPPPINTENPHDLHDSI